jgi:enoyl-CoA hydratase/carnithine racemase
MAEIDLVFEPPLAHLRLDVPERRNAMSLAMWRALPRLCDAIEARPDALVGIVEGAGGHFCAGADILEFDEVFRDAPAARDYLHAIEMGLSALIALDRPVIAALEGAAIGGGLAVALCCDLRFCADDAHLAIPPAKLGLLYGSVETSRLVELVGPSRARDLLYSGRRIATEEALRIGLIDRRVAATELRGSVEAYARDLASASQSSIRGAKRAVEAALARDAAGLHELVEAAAASGDFREGRAAFREKREPRFETAAAPRPRRG